MVITSEMATVTDYIKPSCLPKKLITLTTMTQTISTDQELNPVRAAKHSAAVHTVGVLLVSHSDREG